MSSYLWDPFAALGRFDREFDQIVTKAWGGERSGRPGVRAVRAGFVPAADVVRDGEDVVVAIELPGVDAEDVTVEIERGRLVVRGERAESTASDGGAVVFRERRHGAFRREFSLPDGVTSDAVSASYDRGVLSLRLSGAAAAPRSARIPVVAGAAHPAVEARGTDEAPMGEAPMDAAPVSDNS